MLNRLRASFMLSSPPALSLLLKSVLSHPSVLSASVEETRRWRTPFTSQLGGAARYHGDQAESIFTPAIPKKLNRKSTPLSTSVRSDVPKSVEANWLASRFSSVTGQRTSPGALVELGQSTESPSPRRPELRPSANHNRGSKQLRCFHQTTKQEVEEEVKGCVYLLTACGDECLQVEETDRCRRGGAEGGCAVVAAGRLAVRLRGRVQGHGVLGDPALPAVVLRGQRVRRRKLCGDAVLWGGRVLGRGVGLGHGVRGVGGLLVTLETDQNKSWVSAGERG